MKYFCQACVKKDEGVSRKLLHYLVVEKMDEKVEVAEWWALKNSCKVEQWPKERLSTTKGAPAAP